MVNIESIQTILRYNDWANGQLLDAADAFSDEQLDKKFEIGFSSLRANLFHIYIGEQVWTARWQGRSDTPWPHSPDSITVSSLRDGLSGVQRERDTFVGKIGRAHV